MISLTLPATKRPDWDNKWNEDLFSYYHKLVNFCPRSRQQVGELMEELYRLERSRNTISNETVQNSPRLFFCLVYKDFLHQTTSFPSRIYKEITFYISDYHFMIGKNIDVYDIICEFDGGRFEDWLEDQW
jgi:hypothetical protein